jgi:hypothetical protein
MRALACIVVLTAAAATAAVPTFHGNVEAILQKRCQSCHRPGEAAPFSMLTYKETRPWAKAMKEAVLGKKMPPWMADGGHWANDPQLSPDEIKMLVNWVDGGSLEGAPGDAPPPLKFLEGWNIGQPDVVLEMPKAFEVPAKGTVEYQWVVIPTGFKEDKWIEALEVRPGDRSVVHHVIAFYRRPGSQWLADATPGVPTAKVSGTSETGMSDGSIGGYVPGLPPQRLPEGRAVLLPAGCDIVLQLHYTASGKPASDKTKFGMVFAKHPVTERSFGLGLANTKFVIPPGASGYRVNAEMTLDRDVRIVNFTPHMHLRGKAFEYRAVLPDGTTETLLKVPKYDFNWQLTYQLASERVLPAGTKIQGSAWFDNSPNNPFNPDPKAEVKFGDQTWDEMMVGFVGVAIDPAVSPSKLLRRPAARPAASEAGGQ